MTDDDPTPDRSGSIAAGAFSAWLDEVQAALRGDGGTNVPCGECTACCTSSQFVHIEPDETDALAHIPPELMFPAPRLPRGHVLLGYDELGRCPMLVDDRCSIYEHRPRTCRTYDCRVFPAAGVEADKPRIALRAQRWEFDYPTPADRAEHEAVRAAAAFFHRHAGELPGELERAGQTRLAVMALRVHDVFLAHNEDGVATATTDPDPATVAVELRRRATDR